VGFILSGENGGRGVEGRDKGKGEVWLGGEREEEGGRKGSV